MEINIAIDGVIGREPGEINAAMVQSELARAAGKPICVSINSEGGSVFEGLAIHDALKAYAGPKRCIVQNAFSMGSVLAMAFQQRAITPNGYMMLHAPYQEAGEPKPVLESLRKRLLAIYSAGARLPANSIASMMTAETFLDAAECLKAGFATAIAGPTARGVASFQSMVKSNSRFRSAIVAKLQSDKTMTASQKWNEAYKAAMASTNGDGSKAMKEVDKRFPGLRDQMIKDANKR